MEENNHLNIVDDLQMPLNTNKNVLNNYINTTTIIDFSHRNYQPNIIQEQQQVLNDKNNKIKENLSKNLNQFESINIFNNTPHTNLEIIETNNKNRNDEEKNLYEINKSFILSNNLAFNNNLDAKSNDSLIFKQEFNSNQYLSKITEERNKKKDEKKFSLSKSKNKNLDNILSNFEPDLTSINKNKFKLFPNNLTTISPLTFQENELENEDKFDEEKYSPLSKLSIFLFTKIISLNFVNI